MDSVGIEVGHHNIKVRKDYKQGQIINFYSPDSLFWRELNKITSILPSFGLF